jgi:hypothetical protein
MPLYYDSKKSYRIELGVNTSDIQVLQSITVVESVTFIVYARQLYYTEWKLQL